MRGNITKRGKRSWRLKFETGVDPLAGERKTAFITVRGTRREAEEELMRRLHALDQGVFVEPSKRTLTEWLDQWLADQHGLAAKTAERYRELIDAQIVFHLGGCLIQKLRPAQLKRGGRNGGPLTARTCGHAHRVLRKALADAMRLEIISRNVAASVPPPKVEAKELEILSASQIADVTTSLRGLAVYPIVALALATGMRRGELLALRWTDVDLDAPKLRVERSLEQTQAGGVGFKAPKTKHGRRCSGVLPSPEGGPRSPRALTKEWTL